MENIQIIPNIDIKEEDPIDVSSLRIDDSRSEFNSSVYSDESVDSGATTVSNQSATPLVTFAANTKVSCVEKEPRKEDKPTVHRNTGIISVSNYRRRRLLSQSSIRLPVTLFDSINNCTPKQECRLSINETPLFSHRPIQSAMPAPAEMPMVSVPAGMARGIEISQDIEMTEAVVLHSTKAMNSIVTGQIVTVPRIETVPNTFCVVCNQNYKSRATLQTHFKSQKHQRNLERSNW